MASFVSVLKVVMIGSDYDCMNGIITWTKASFQLNFQFQIFMDKDEFEHYTNTKGHTKSHAF